MKFRKIEENLNSSATYDTLANLMCKLDYASDNKIGLQKLTEETLNRIVTKHHYEGYAIISACRSMFYKIDKTEVPREKMAEVSEGELVSGAELAEINNARTRALKEKIIKANFSFLPVYGGYKEEGNDMASYEKSFIVFDFDRQGNKRDFNELYDFVINQGVEFNQDTILVKAPNEVPKYIICCSLTQPTGSVDMEFSDKYTLNDLAQQYFTALKNIKSDKDMIGKPQRFTLESLYINGSPQSVHEATRRHYHNELF